MKYSFLYLLVIFLFSRCVKEAEPYTIFKDEAHQAITDDTARVELNQSYVFTIHNGYRDADPSYFLQKNNGAPFEVSTSTILTLEAYGWDTKAKQKYQTVGIPLTFNNVNYVSGDCLKVIVYHSEKHYTKTFEVQ